MVGDVFDWVGDRFSDVGDVVSDVFGEIPGSPELVDAIKDIVRGPLRDFARTPVGMVVLRAMSTTIYGPWAYAIGPQLASIVFALPGLARGQDFWEAWFDEVRWRTEKTAEVLGGEAAAQAVARIPEVKRLADRLSTELGDQALSMLLPELAAVLGVDEWTAAFALHTAFEEIPMPPREDWDPFTWKKRATLARHTGLRTSVNRWAYQSSYEQPAATRVNRLAYAQEVRPPNAPPVKVAAPSPFVAATPPSTNKQIGDVLLVVTVGAAAAALVWFFAWEKKRA